jgi:hypothetical protein
MANANGFGEQVEELPLRRRDIDRRKACRGIRVEHFLQRIAAEKLINDIAVDGSPVGFHLGPVRDQASTLLVEAL